MLWIQNASSYSEETIQWEETDFSIAQVSWRSCCAVLDFFCPFQQGGRVFWGWLPRLMGRKLSWPSARCPNTVFRSQLIKTVEREWQSFVRTFILWPTRSGRGGVGGGDFSTLLGTFLLLFNWFFDLFKSSAAPLAFLLLFMCSCFHLRSRFFKTLGGKVKVSLLIEAMLHAAISRSMRLSMYFLEYLPWSLDCR